MKAVKLLGGIGLITACGFVFALNAAAQETVPTPTENPTAKEIKKDSADAKKDSAEAAKTEAQPKETPTPETKIEQTVDAAKTESAAIDAKADEKNMSDEEKGVITYYTNYLTEYRLGPNDVISVEVFGQCPDYCKENLTVPPTARISYPLIRGGVMVGGRTVEDVQEEITKKLDEYIIEPKVTVTLVKAMSARYSVMGKVVTPGIRVMDRKVSLSEAIIESGGVAKNGDRKKIALLRFDAQGKLSRQNVNLADIESGKAPMIYLNPGDQVLVPGKGFTIDSMFDVMNKVSIVRLLFGSPF